MMKKLLMQRIEIRKAGRLRKNVSGLFLCYTKETAGFL
jgi:hypothetical protein